MERDRMNMLQYVKNPLFLYTVFIDLNLKFRNIAKEEKNKERLLKEKERNEQQLGSIEENFTRAQSINSSVNQDIQKESKRYELRQEAIAVC